MTRPRLLFVDDEPAILAAMARNFRRNYDVATATSAFVGLEMLACDERGFDVVISDFQMPGIDGVAFLARARAAQPAIGCILLTGGDGGPPLADVTRLAKPCSRADLLAAIEAALARGTRSPCPSNVSIAS